jgi:hypothetical protein
MKLENIEKSAELKRWRDEIVSKRKAMLAPRAYRVESSANDDDYERASTGGTVLNAALHGAIAAALRAYYDGLIADIDEKLAVLGVVIGAGPA